jgi:hypothetical protein
MKPVRHIYQFLFLGGIVLLLIIAVKNLIPGAGASLQSSGYPPPVGTTPPYPPPLLNVTATPNLSIPITTASPQPLRSAKDGHILSPTEIAAIATYDYEGMLLLTPPPPDALKQVTPPSFPVASLSDLPQVVYNDPFYGSDDTGLGSCIKSKNPGSAVFVQSLNTFPSYYIVPFYKDNKVCAKALIEVKNGFGDVEALGGSYEEKFPQLSADEAANQVVMKTGKQVANKPIFVFGGFREAGNPLNPIWQVTTTDGQVYFVIVITGLMENSAKGETTITVFNANEVHPIK